MQAGGRDLLAVAYCGVVGRASSCLGIYSGVGDLSSVSDADLMNKIYPFGIRLSLIVDGRQEGTPWRREQNNGKIYYDKGISLWDRFDHLIHYFIIFFLMAISLWLFSNLMGNSSKNILRDIIVGIGLFIGAIVGILLETQAPNHYPFMITDEGFIYPYQFHGLKRKDNFIPFSEIKEIAFSRYGLDCLILLKSNVVIGVRSGDDYQGYFILVQLLIKYLKIDNALDFSMVDAFYQSHSREERMRVIRQLMDKNQNLSEPPQDWLKKMKSGNKRFAK